ncbi:MAG: ribonuclease H-like domain-containing protein [Desulfuromonadaceae bacterium]
MLTNSFRFLPGISALGERQLWQAGVHGWDQLQQPVPCLSAGRLKTAREQMAQARLRLAERDPVWFSERLPAKEHWRLFPEFRDRIAYLDIETTGLARHDQITTIALYDGRRIRTYVQGDNLAAFQTDIREYDLLVTYNGKCFDVPFIEKTFAMHLPQAHIDLRFLLRDLGFRGGLKGCERQLGLDRGQLQDLDGFFAVRLWQDYQRSGRRASLETLLAYNIEDVVNLETLLVLAYNKKLQGTPFADSRRLVLPRRPDIPFAADAATIRRLHSRY